uniref:alpha-1,2-Mannosidase n=1 Tax=Rhodosorus marinus TaxID=101924 RepID=A0A7S2ZUJ4_9RHOD|mmetsp:Transcript_32936/g.129305  ORF Transcript_32936/g.129305 Transcript_32936/m.129305 type:complete len:351 (+) Transcript_32936:138-1190(+)
MVGRKWWTIVNGKKMTTFGSANRKVLFLGVSGIILVLLGLIWRGHRAPDWERPPLGVDEQAMVIEVAGGEFVEFRPSDKLFVVSAEDARKQVVEAMKHAWGSYVKYAWGKDELAPLSRVGVDTFGSCTGITIVDAADTLYIMGLKDEFKKAREWIAGVDFDCIDEHVSVFETTIRSLGGLMSLYELTDDKVFLEKAESLGMSLRHSFDSKHSVPSNSCNLNQKDCAPGFRASLASIGTTQLEWRALAYHTKKQELKQAARESQCVMMGLMNASPPSKLAPSNVSPASHEERDVTGGELDKLCPNHRHFRLSGSTRTGGEGDSYYEYLLKVGCWSLPGTIPVAMEQEGPRT